MSEKKNPVASNPLLILFLGACPALASTIGVKPALGMGAAVLVVLVLSALLVSLLGKKLENRLPVCVVAAAGFASIVQMLMNAFLPDVYRMLGVYVAVVAVDLLVYASAENAGDTGAAVADAFKTGVLFLVFVLVMGAVRELFGAGTIAGVAVPVLESHTISVLTKAPGGFIVFSILAAVVSKMGSNKSVKEGEQ